MNGHIYSNRKTFMIAHSVKNSDYKTVEVENSNLHLKKNLNHKIKIKHSRITYTKKLNNNYL